MPSQAPAEKSLLWASVAMSAALALASRASSTLWRRPGATRSSPRRSAERTGLSTAGVPGRGRAAGLGRTGVGGRVGGQG